MRPLKWKSDDTWDGSWDLEKGPPTIKGGERKDPSS